MFKSKCRCCRGLKCLTGTGIGQSAQQCRHRETVGKCCIRSQGLLPELVFADTALVVNIGVKNRPQTP